MPTGTTAALVNALRIVTVPVRLLAEAIDGLITSLAERSETGISGERAGTRTWVAIVAQVAWGIAAVVLRVVSAVTVFVRQVATTVDDFLRSLSEGTETPSPPTPPTPGPTV